MPGLTVQELAAPVGISIATLSRWRQHRQPLDLYHGERSLRFARLDPLAFDRLDGDEVAARDWLRRPAIASGGAGPLHFAGTEVGAREVEHLIGRIEQGICT